MSLAFGLDEASGVVVGDAVSSRLFWRFIIGEGDLEDSFLFPSTELFSLNVAAKFDDRLLVVVFADADVDDGGGEFDKIDVEDVDEFLGMIEWKAEPLFPVAAGAAAEEIGLELGGFGDEAGDPVDPTLGGGGGNE